MYFNLQCLLLLYKQTSNIDLLYKQTSHMREQKPLGFGHAQGHERGIDLRALPVEVHHAHLRVFATYQAQVWLIETCSEYSDRN